MASIFNRPPAGAARYLAIYPPTHGLPRHHVELYSPALLHPINQDNVYIWAANDLREVCMNEFKI